MRGGVTCYDEKGWANPKGEYTKDYNDRLILSDECPKSDAEETSSSSDWESDWGARRGY